MLMIEHRQLVLHRDAGGRWRLDAPRKAWSLAGQRVCVVGTRADFDLLEVTSLAGTTSRDILISS